MASAFDSTYTRIDPRTPGYVPETTLGESISAQWALWNSEYLGRSAADAWTNKRRERRLAINKILPENEQVDTLTPLSRNIFGPHPTMSYPIHEEPQDDFILSNGQTIAQFATENDGIMSDDELWQQIVADKNAVKDRANDVASRASGFTNILGSLIGGFGASLRDPAILMTLAFGASTSASVLRVALIEAGIGGVSEALVQPNIISFQQGLGRDVTAVDAVKNIAFVSVAAGIFGGTLRGVALMSPLRRWKHPYTKDTDALLERMALREMNPEEQLAFRFLDQHNEIVSRNPFDVTDPTSARVHGDALGLTMEALDNYKTADYNSVLFGRDAARTINPDMVADQATKDAFESFKKQEKFAFGPDFDNEMRELELITAAGDPELKQQADIAFREANTIDIDVPTLEQVGDEISITGSRKSKELLREALEDEKAATRLKACQLGA